MLSPYQQVQKSLAQGWNTWNTASVLSHVLLPQGFALNLGLRDYVSRQNLKSALIGRPEQRPERVHPGPRAYNGSYTELTLHWQGIELRVQSAKEGKDLVILVTPVRLPPQTIKPPLLVVEAGVLWNRPGYVCRVGGRVLPKGQAGREPCLEGHFEGEIIPVYATQESLRDPHVQATGPYLNLSLGEAVGISTGVMRSLEGIQAIIGSQQAAFLASFNRYGDLAEVYKAIQTAMAWDTIYEPEHERVVSPVSRLWNLNWGGYVLFEWDNYFAGYMAAVTADFSALAADPSLGEDRFAIAKALAYANAVEMTREITENGLVPNFATVNGCSSRDRSEPPVGALICRELYRLFGEKWFLEEVYPSLLRWNRWWDEKRSLAAEYLQPEKLLCWGSDPYEPVLNTSLELEHVNARQGGAWESGLDNLPVYDDVPFDPDLHLLLIHDAGLNGLYVEDCEALAEMALALGRAEEVKELSARAERYRCSLAWLWDETSGIYRNRYTQSGEFSQRLAPTSFYPLLAQALTPEQAERMIHEHFYNPKEFWGEYLIPSISRDDPAYPEQLYWRGRIWGPMNLLTYFSLKKYPSLAQACKDMAEKSVKLLMKEWLEHGHIHENYNCDTGEGCDSPHSDAFYHWGGLLGIPALIEAGLLS
jgi:hypothetical protein